jgi:DNA-binding transcriptional regulator YdaS (Cro superfamily)
MYKNDAIKFFGNRVKLALAAGVKPPSVSTWGDLVPEKRAVRLEKASKGALVYNPDLYIKSTTTKE